MFISPVRLHFNVGVYGDFFSLEELQFNCWLHFSAVEVAACDKLVFVTKLNIIPITALLPSVFHRNNILLLTQITVLKGEQGVAS